MAAAKLEHLDNPTLGTVSASKTPAASVNQPTIQEGDYLVRQPPRHLPRSVPASQHSQVLALAEEVFSVLQSQLQAISSGRLHLLNRAAVSSALQEALVVDLEVGQTSLAITTSKTTNSRSRSHSATLPLLQEDLGQVVTRLVQTTPATLAVGFSAARPLPLSASRSSSRLSRTHSVALVNQTKTKIRPTTPPLVALANRNSENRSRAGYLAIKPILILEGDCLAILAKTTTNSNPRQEEDYLGIPPTTNLLEARCSHLSLLTLVEASLGIRPQTIPTLEVVSSVDSVTTTTMRISSRIRLVDCSETPPTSSKSLEVYLVTPLRTRVVDCLATRAIITTSKEGVTCSEETISNSSNLEVSSVIPTTRAPTFLDHSNNSSSLSSNKTLLHPHPLSMHL